jgi:hypothetical protein
MPASGGERSVVGWLLDEGERATLLERFAPAYPDVVAHHVTLASGTNETTPLPSEYAAEVVGIADDGEGVQALVVRIGGTTARADGGTYHITWSLDRAKGRKAQHSNDVLARQGWTRFASPIAIRLIPARFPAS